MGLIHVFCMQMYSFIRTIWKNHLNLYHSYGFCNYIYYWRSFMDILRGNSSRSIEMLRCRDQDAHFK